MLDLGMELLKKCCCRIGHLLLGFVKILRKVICCRKRREPDYLLPMTVDHIVGSQNEESVYGNAQWESWPDSGTGSSSETTPQNRGMKTDSESDSVSILQEETNEEDFFKDMVPQIRKPKKVFMRKETIENEGSKCLSNRLALDPKAMFVNPGLGTMDDHPTSWENSEIADDIWAAEALIKETKRAEQERRRAEHQQKKQDRESRRHSKPDSLISMLNISDSSDKHKNC